MAETAIPEIELNDGSLCPSVIALQCMTTTRGMRTILFGRGHDASQRQLISDFVALTL